MIIIINISNIKKNSNYNIMETDLERIGMQINQKQREEYLKEQS